MTAAPIASSPSFPPDEASSWRRIRRYAVPRWMIEAATERRLAGDWQGACAAANVDVALDLAGVARDHGPAMAAAVEDDLGHLAPDLLRWHLPRVLHGRTTLGTGRTVLLARYDRAGAPGRRGLLPPGGGRRGDRMSGPVLHLGTSTMVDGPQRVTLLFGDADRDEKPDVVGELWQNWLDARHLWDARRADELRERCGGGTRAPFFRTDGSPLGPAGLPAGPTAPGRADPAAHTEWVTGLHERGEIAAAFAAAGVELDETPPQKRPYRTPVVPSHVLGRRPLALTRLAPEVERLSALSGSDRFLIPVDRRVAVLLRTRRGGLRAQVVDTELKESEPLPDASWRRLPDLDLLRAGLIGPDELHPLVRAALFPDRPVTADQAGSPGPEPLSPVRVRCRGEWHEVASEDGLLRIPHTDAEQQRERTMRASGGAIAGCFAVHQAWTSGTGRLPKALRAHRQELFAHVQHGDTPAVLRLLDAGLDPNVRDGRQRTLLHLLHLLHHEELLPRLLAAGLDLEARDHHERTPLHIAIGDRGSTDLVSALLEAGAKIDVVDHQGWSLRDLIRRHKRPELDHIAERVKELGIEGVFDRYFYDYDDSDDRFDGEEPPW